MKLEVSLPLLVPKKNWEVDYSSEVGGFSPLITPQKFFRCGLVRFEVSLPFLFHPKFFGGALVTLEVTIPLIKRHFQLSFFKKSTGSLARKLVFYQ